MLFLLLNLFSGIVRVSGDVPYTCPDDIYCHGNLLDTVQMAGIYKDSKTFVDMKMKYDRAKTMQAFDALMAKTGGKPDKDQVGNFVKNNFDGVGSEFEEWTPDDWIENPKFIDDIKNSEGRQWVKELNLFWKELGRKMKKDVKMNQDRYSIIYVANPFVIPGGRFREFYYWDSYWIVKGLLHCQMYSTVRGMLSNFVSMVERYGFVPNGGRIYYTMRSQPPFLISMFKSYVEATNDYAFLGQNIDSLEREIQFWFKNRTVSVQVDSREYVLARYADSSVGPRPESYKEDVSTARPFDTEQSKIEFYSQIKSTAESGWDFSSRWFISENGGNSYNLTDVQTENIIPVDLNSMIYMNAEIMSEFYEALDKPKKALLYSRIARNWKKAVNKVLWHDDIGSWLDYDLKNGVRRNYFFASNFFPLWTKCYDDSRSDLVGKVINYMKTNGLDKFPGGIPNTLSPTGQQWDYPNAWPPSQWVIIEGLNSTEHPCAQIYARNLARKWVKSNYDAYNSTKAMYEKYDATVFGGHGGGGEYDVQLGFGWSNGIIMDLLAKFPDAMTSENESEDCSTHFAPSNSNQLKNNLLSLSVPLIVPLFLQKFNLALYTNYMASIRPEARMIR